jgi:hypothetical protein
MAWKRRSTSVSVDVDLDDFSAEQLLQGLIDAKWISEEEAETIKTRSPGAKLIGAPNPVGEDLENARRALRRGNKSEALHFIEYHLGREWIGTLQ